MVILTGDIETVIYDKEKDRLWIKEVFHNGVLIGINVMINNKIIDTYSNDECAEQILKYLFNTTETKINIDEVNFKLEVF